MQKKQWLLVCSPRIVYNFIIFSYFFFHRKKLRSPEGGPERGPEGGPEGGVQKGGPGFVYTRDNAPIHLTISRREVLNNVFLSYKVRIQSA